MTDFDASAARALASVYRAFGKDAIYTPPGTGSPTACRVLLQRHSSREEGGTFTVGSKVYPVADAPMPNDADSDLEWRVRTVAGGDR